MARQDTGTAAHPSLLFSAKYLTEKGGIPWGVGGNQKWIWVLIKVKAWEGPFTVGYLAELTPWCKSFLHKHSSEYWSKKDQPEVNPHLKRPSQQRASLRAPGAIRSFPTLPAPLKKLAHHSRLCLHLREHVPASQRCGNTKRHLSEVISITNGLFQPGQALVKKREMLLVLSFCLNPLNVHNILLSRCFWTLTKEKKPLPDLAFLKVST